MPKKAVCSFLILGLSGYAFAAVSLLTGNSSNQLHDHDSLIVDISSDGRFVLFQSGPPAVGSTPGITQNGLYLKDLVGNSLTYASVLSAGYSGDPTTPTDGSVSDDGRFVAWNSAQSLVYWRDLLSGETRLLTPNATNTSRHPIISGDGRYVAYVSIARNIVTDSSRLPANGRAAVLLYDSQTQTTTVASLAQDGAGLSTGIGASSVAHTEFDFSTDGRYVVFSSDAANVHAERTNAAAATLLWVYRRNLLSGEVDIVSRNAAGQYPYGSFSSPRVSGDGRRVLFTGGFVAAFGGPGFISGYSNPFGTDFFMKDLMSNEFWLVTKTLTGNPSDGVLGTAVYALSADGQTAAFGSTGTMFVAEPTDAPGSSDAFDMFRVDIGAAGAVTTSLLTKPVVGTSNVGYFSGPFITTNGSYVAFVSRNHYPLLGAGLDSSIYVHGFGVGTLPGQSSATSTLNFAMTPGQLTFSWPAASGMKLYSSSNLFSSSWLAVTNSPGLANGTNTLAIPMSDPARFFRLQSDVP